MLLGNFFFFYLSHKTRKETILKKDALTEGSIHMQYNVSSPSFFFSTISLQRFTAKVFFFSQFWNYLTHNVYWMKRNRLDGFRKDRKKQNKHHLTKVTKIVLIINGSYDVTPLNSSSFFPTLLPPIKGSS